MKQKNLLPLLILFLLFCNAGLRAQTIIRPSAKTRTSFAIFIDRMSYEKSGAAVDAYRKSIEDDGLGTYLIIDDFKSPEPIREMLVQYHADRKQPLEGCVFVGDIPIPMVRDAQYLTSAFKMNQTNDWQRSSVPSDRYYDDFSLKFEFIKQDKDIPLYFYYSLSPDSKTYLSPDIYSGRIKPCEVEGKDKYRLLADYLMKVVREKQTANILDRLTMARGHSYNSEDRQAWAGEQIALREQLPQLFRSGGTVKFMDYDDMYPMKPMLLNEVQSTDLDVMIYHHHGAVTTEYINGYPEESNVRPSIENVKRYLRNKVSQRAEKVGREQAVREYQQSLDVPASWCEEAFDSAKIISDSTFNASLDIYASDIHRMCPGAKFVLFDACFNGSFHEKDYQAGAYVFAPGHTVTTIGGTVNALQDKWPDEFIGLLAAGLRIGQLNRFTGYLESHVIGDPTFRFANNTPLAFDINQALTLHDRDAAFWRKQLGNVLPDVQAMALRQLLYAGERNMPARLAQTYKESEHFVVRMEAVRLLSLFYPEQAISTLQLSLNDSYELVRRLSCEYVERIGDPAFVPAVVRTYLDRGTERRLKFRLASATSSFEPEVMETELDKLLQNRILYSDTIVRELRKAYKTEQTRRTNDCQTIAEDGQKIGVYRNAIYTYRNHPTPLMADLFINTACDNTRPIEVRIFAIQTLGWYDLCYRRAAIADRLAQIQTDDDAMQRELTRTITRLRGTFGTNKRIIGVR